MVPQQTGVDTAMFWYLETQDVMIPLYGQCHVNQPLKVWYSRLRSNGYRDSLLGTQCSHCKGDLPVPGFEAALHRQALLQQTWGMSSNPVRAVQQGSLAEQGWMVITISDIHHSVRDILSNNIAPAISV